jgi:hypothetical protein
MGGRKTRPHFNTGDAPRTMMSPRIGPDIITVELACIALVLRFFGEPDFMFTELG